MSHAMYYLFIKLSMEQKQRKTPNKNIYFDWFLFCFYGGFYWMKFDEI